MLGVGEHLTNRRDHLVDRRCRPRPPLTTLGCRCSARDEIGHQRVDVSLGEPLHRQITVTLPQRREIIAQLRQRRSAQVVTARE